MKILVNNEIVTFHKQALQGYTSEYYFDDHKRYFLKYNKQFKNWYVNEREVFILKLLEKYPKHFPKYVSHTKDYLITLYSGEPLNKTNKPANINIQIDEILKALSIENICHNDIKLNELLVDKENNLVLVDFGWAMINGSLSFSNITVKAKRPQYSEKSDRQMINDIISSL